MSATLWASSDAHDTDWAVMLLDVFPDGHAERVQDGFARARFRKGMDREVPLVKGQVERYDIDLWFTSKVFAAGPPAPGQHHVGAVPQVRPEPEHRREQRAGLDVRGGAPAGAARRGAPVACGAAGGSALNRKPRNTGGRSGPSAPRPAEACADHAAPEGDPHPSAQADLPRSPSTPSHAMKGIITSAATGSAHHQPKRALSARPPRRMADR